jgi:hypothetical protein
LSSQQRPCSRSRRWGSAALLVALVAGLAAAPATRGEHDSAHDGHPAAKRYLAQAQGKVGAPEDKPVPVPEAASDDGLPVVPLVVGLLIFGGASALLVRRRVTEPGGGRPGPGRSATPGPGRLDSN